MIVHVYIYIYTHKCKYTYVEYGVIRRQQESISATMYTNKMIQLFVSTWERYYHVMSSQWEHDGNTHGPKLWGWGTRGGLSL